MQEKGNLSINSENFMPIIKKWLYTDKDIFIRELVSNACDAVTKLQKLSMMGEADIPAEEAYEIHVVLDQDKKTLQIIDNGIGMTADEIKKYINQIAFSGATDFLSKFEGKTEDEGSEIIGHFGLGFYSAFMVADTVEIDSLSYQKDAVAAKWRCNGGIDYEMEAGERTERGTTITLFIGADGEEFLNEATLYAAMRKYCAFMPVSIFVDVLKEETEEEKAAHLAEREARAAARKRERDRLAREAALAAAETVEAQKAPAEAPAQVEVPTVEAGPVFEEVTVPETFGFAEPPLVETDPAAFVQAPVSAEGPVVKTEPTPGESQEIPVFAPGAEADQAPVEESAKTQWDTLKDLETLSQAADEGAPAIPVMPQAEHTEVQIGETVPAAPAQETKEPDGQETAAPQEGVPAEKPVETEEDLDALLSEIRDLLADSPVPKLDPEQLKKPPQPVPEVSIPDAAPVPPAEAPAADAAPAPTPAESPAQAEPAPEIPTVEEPTIPIGEIPSQEIGQDAGQAPAEQVPASVFDEQPTQVIPTQEIAEEMQAQEEAAPQEELLAAVRPPRERAPRERAAARKPEKKTKKKGGPNVALILLSLVIVAAAAFIVVRNVVPAFQDGILGGGEPKTAEGLTLDRTALDLAEAGTTMALVPTFSPEGATAQLTWTSSKPEVATVDEKGTVTAVAPGTAVITASMENGQKAECTVNCTWSADAPSQEPAGTEPAANGADAPAETKPTLSANDITLDSEGDTQQITVTGASGEVTWTSSDTKIATVTADGTITAVAPGRATVTAKVGDQTLNCAVRCIW